MCRRAFKKCTFGPKRIKTKRLFKLTSVKSPKTAGSERRTNAEIGSSKKSTSPISTFAPSAPGGIFFINAALPCN